MSLKTKFSHLSQVNLINFKKWMKENSVKTWKANHLGKPKISLRRILVNLLLRIELFMSDLKVYRVVLVWLCTFWTTIAPCIIDKFHDLIWWWTIESLRYRKLPMMWAYRVNCHILFCTNMRSKDGLQPFQRNPQRVDGNMDPLLLPGNK